MPMVSKVLGGLERLGTVQEVDSKKGGAKTRGSQSIFQPLPKPSPPADGLQKHLNMAFTNTETCG